MTSSFRLASSDPTDLCTCRSGERGMRATAPKRRILTLFGIVACGCLCLFLGSLVLVYLVSHDDAKSKSHRDRMQRQHQSGGSSGGGSGSGKTGRNGRDSITQTISERFWSTIDDARRSPYALSTINSVCDQNFGRQFMQSWKDDRYRTPIPPSLYPLLHMPYDVWR